ncbi:MAG TPA: class I SAM-dependent methyltransferase [Chitinophagaceae bacterium]
MQHTNNNMIVQNLPWFKSWFDTAYYHKLYAHRSEKEAADFINELISELQPEEHSVMLDVGCGNGRHCRQLAAKGFNVTGIDLAFSSIRQAKKYVQKGFPKESFLTFGEISVPQFFQHDMRKPFGNNHYDYVFSFFTSFGYFKEDTENQRVIRNMANALKPGGVLVFDYINAEYTAKHLVPSEEKEIDGIIYAITRWMDEKYFFKRIIIEDNQLGEDLAYTEQVARFDLNDFEFMFTLNCLEIEKVYGDYMLNEYDNKKSPRLIIIARKNGN